MRVLSNSTIFPPSSLRTYRISCYGLSNIPDIGNIGLVKVLTTAKHVFRNLSFLVSHFIHLLKHKELTEENVPVHQVKTSFHVDLDGFCGPEGT